jgi:hypothetical protein
MDLVIWIEMNKIIFSVVILVPVLGSTAFVAPVLAEETKTDHRNKKLQLLQKKQVLFRMKMRLLKMP